MLARSIALVLAMSGSAAAETVHAAGSLRAAV